VTKLVAENKHLKQTYKKLYNSIKSSRVRSKEQCDDLIKQVNIKSAENSDLNASLQENVLVITTLKDTLSKLKGKAMVNKAVPLHSIDLELLKIDVALLAPKLRNNRTTHNDYLKHTQEETVTLREIVENERLLNPLNTSLDYTSILSVPNSKLNVNYDLKCTTCNGCLFYDNHDSCVLEFINSVNARVKSKSAKKPVNKKIWQPTGKMFTTIGHKWRPTGWTFTLVGNVCLLTRITTTAIVPLRKPIPIESNTSKPVVILVYSRKSKEAKNTVPVSKSKINKSLGLVRGLPKLKFEKDHLCSACAMSKSKKKSHKPKSEDTNQEKLYLLHMDLCGPMRVESVNGKKYILIIVDDYSRFTWVKFLRSKDEAPDSIIKFLKMIQVGISHEISVAHSPQQNGVVERHNHTLIEAARTMLIYAQASLFLWAEAVATACYIQYRSIIRLRHGKTPYELLHNKLPDLSFLYVFGALFYPTNDSENLGKLQPKVDIGIFIGYSSTKKAFRRLHHGKTPYELLHNKLPGLSFLYVFGALFYPTNDIDQDAPLPSKSQTTPETKSFVIPQDVEEYIHDIEVAHMGNDPLFGVPYPKVTFAQSSSTVSPYTIVQSDHQIPQHNSKWTKDHPLDNIIGQLSRLVSTQLQLHEQALFCFYDAFLTSVEPKTYNDALTRYCWIEAMQEELNEFKRLEPNGFVDQDNPKHVYKLKKALYGLKQGPHVWYDMLSSFLISQDFSKDRLLALEALAACLPFSEIVSLGPAATIGGVIVVSELLLVFRTLALGLGGVALVATA
nr:retrovirus-related Pol polyprotein from transposon TNT 1-94 [Tanacetum cinerariifolium]